MLRFGRLWLTLCGWSGKLQVLYIHTSGMTEPLLRHDRAGDFQTAGWYVLMQQVLSSNMVSSDVLYNIYDAACVTCKDVMCLLGSGAPVVRQCVTGNYGLQIMNT